MSKTRAILVFVMMGFGIYFIISFAISLVNLNDAQKEADAANKELIASEQDLAYEYGKCVFYDQLTVEFCNNASANKGLPLYEKYYGDGSWTVAGDPTP